MMKWLLLPVALTISAIAAFYSIYGLVAIFAAAVIPIIIMGVALEIGKLVSVVYLHQYWEETKLLLKSYLIVAVALLMFITSLGIFGFLSKAHVEQASLSEEQIALIEQLEDKEIRSELKIDRWEKELTKLLNNEDTRVDTLIGNEQEQLNNIYDRIEREKNSANEAYNQKVRTINETITGFGSNARKTEQIEIANAELKKTINDLRQSKYIKHIILLLGPDLNKELFKSSFGRFFSTLAHEMSHVFGADGQREFSDVLTHLLEQAVLKNKVIGQYSKKWKAL